MTSKDINISSWDTVHIQTPNMDDTIYILSSYDFGLIIKTELVTWRFVNCIVHDVGFDINILPTTKVMSYLKIKRF
jgi:hypothetical protein